MRRRDEDRPRVRRFEPFPRWGYVLFVLTVVVTPIAWRTSVSDVIGPNGTNCGPPLFGRDIGIDALPGSACTKAVSDAQPLAVVFGVLAIVLILASITTLVVRGFVPREPDTPD